MAKVQKTLFFLGAGFSKDAGGPIQNEIVKTLLSEEFCNIHQSDLGVQSALKIFKEFLEKELFINENQYSNVVLEDVFTPIDRCIVEGRSYGSYSHSMLVELREKLHYLLAKSIQYGVDIKGGNKQYINDFANYINTLAKRRLDDFKEDNVAILTTNWDILLDNALNRIVKHETDCISQGDYERGPIAVVDYCCYISSLEDDSYIKPGLFALGRKGYSIKYLKLHGSMNWLHCPNCQRLYVKFDEKTMFAEKYCKHCAKNFKHLNREKNSIKLKGNLLLPTFIKDLKNIQLQLVWQNAGIELSEATKIVFIGYSLPVADFEIRQLLSRFVRKNAIIEVVVFPGGNPDSEIKRYQDFFGKRKVILHKMTVPEYIKKELMKN